MPITGAVISVIRSRVACIIPLYVVLLVSEFFFKYVAASQYVKFDKSTESTTRERAEATNAREGTPIDDRKDANALQ